MKRIWKEFIFDHLPIRVAGEGVYDPEYIGLFVVGEFDLTVRLKLPFGEPDVGLRYDGRQNALSEHFVWESRNARIEDVFVGGEHLLDLDRVNVLPASDDLIFVSTLELNKAVLVEPSEISGQMPPVAKLRGGLLRTIPIAAHDDRAMECKFADLAGRKRVTVFVDDLELHARRR